MIRLVAFLVFLFLFFAIFGENLVKFVKQKMKTSPNDLYKIMALALFMLFFVLAISLVFPVFVVIFSVFAFFVLKKIYFFTLN